jgi:anthranilate phosphoribosyltransferase
MTIREAIAAAVAGRDLSEADAAAAMQDIMTDGAATPSQIAALLIALRIKGETVDEIAGMVRVMREKAVPLKLDGDVLDVVSTGGGAFDPVNISTGAALVCASCGVKVAKHGNRGFTSMSGAANVLEALGARIDLSPEGAGACIEKAGFCFLLAPVYHPSMRFAGPTRAEIGVRTIFNSLGPLTNPAGAQYQLTGVGDPKLAPKIAEVMARLGTRRSLVVHSDDGLDELSLGAPTQVYDITGHDVKHYTLTPEDAGLPRIPLAEVKSGSAAENAQRLRAVFNGTKGADRDYVLINAGAALMVAGKAATVRDGVRLASQAIDSGATARTLDAYIAASNEAPA